jgi:uncharacterized sporulation protein YeaH/YhbH (DUF444 family)
MSGRRIREDHKQYRDLIRDNVRSRVKDHIKTGQKVKRRGKDTIVIDIPVIELPQFRYKHDGDEGIGNGPADLGDVVGHGPEDDADNPGIAGDNEGEHTIGVGISVDDYIDILGEELELPNLKPKDNSEVVIEKIKYNQISKVGNPSLLHKKKTLKNVIKRAISSNAFDPNDIGNLYPLPDDKQYRSWSKKDVPEVNAAIFFMSDVSASMTPDKRDLIKELCWYLDNWIRKFYSETKLNYIVHDWAAAEVDQEKFYGYTSSGGTKISSAFELAKDIIENRYPLDEWNIYVFYLSDGENWGSDNDKAADCIKILQRWCNVIGITEVRGDSDWSQFAKHIESGIRFGNIDESVVVTGVVKEHEQVLKQLKKLLLVGNGQWIDT